MALTAELMKDIKGEMPVIETEAQVRFAQDLMPVLWNARDAGQDMELAGWKWFLHFIDGRLGSQRFERMINEYMALKYVVALLGIHYFEITVAVLLTA